jgi:hypothetical protein
LAEWLPIIFLTCPAALVWVFDAPLLHAQEPSIDAMSRNQKNFSGVSFGQK